MSNVTLTDNIILGLARRDDVKKEFPFLNNVTATEGKRGCRCGGKKGKRQKDGINSARAAILNLSADRLARLKKLINPKISRLTVYHKAGRGIDKKVL
jgi:hypothetical protein